MPELVNSVQAAVGAAQGGAAPPPARQGSAEQAVTGDVSDTVSRGIEGSLRGDGERCGALAVSPNSRCSSRQRNERALRSRVRARVRAGASEARAAVDGDGARGGVAEVEKALDDVVRRHLREMGLSEGGRAGGGEGRG